MNPQDSASLAREDPENFDSDHLLLGRVLITLDVIRRFILPEQKWDYLVAIKPEGSKLTSDDHDFSMYVIQKTADIVCERYGENRIQVLSLLLERKDDGLYNIHQMAKDSLNCS